MDLVQCRDSDSSAASVWEWRPETIHEINRALEAMDDSSRGWMRLSFADNQSNTQAVGISPHNEATNPEVPCIRIQDVYQTFSEFMSDPENRGLDRRIYDMGDRLRERGEAMSLRIPLILAQERSQWSAEDLQIIRLMFNAALLLGEEYGLLRLVLNTETNSELGFDPIILAQICVRMSTLRLRSGLIGEKYAIDQEARQSGLVQDSLDAMDALKLTLADREMRLEAALPVYEQIRQQMQDRTGLPLNLLMMEHQTYYRSIGPEIKVEDIANVIDSLKEVKESDEMACPFCLEPLLEVKNVVRTVCNHYMHVNCLYEWVNSTADNGNLCDCCRTKMCERRSREPDPFMQHCIEIVDNFQQLEVSRDTIGDVLYDITWTLRSLVPLENFLDRYFY